MHAIRNQLNLPFDVAIEKVTQALKSEGFGVLTSIDLRAIFKEKLNVDFRPYQILGVCNPSLAYRAIEEDLDIGLLLPCNVIVQEQPNGIVQVAFIDPKLLLPLVGSPALDAMTKEIKATLLRVSKNLAEHHDFEASSQSVF